VKQRVRTHDHASDHANAHRVHRAHRARTIALASAAAVALFVSGGVVGALVYAGHSTGTAGTIPVAGARTAPSIVIPTTGDPKTSSAKTSGPSSSASARSSAASHVDAVPAGVSLTQIDGGVGYFSRWPNGFPASSSFIPVGVYPSQATPSALAGEGVNFFTPMRNEQAGTWCPVWSNPNGNDMTAVNAQPGFYAGGTFYEKSDGRSWGPRAAFDVFGDELDGTSQGFFDCLPSTITSHNEAGSWGGLAAPAFLAAETAAHAADPTRPSYIQVTTSFIDGGADEFYTFAQKQAICAGADILSFDVYPLVMRGGQVWDTYDEVEEARRYCQDSRPVMAFTEMDHMDGGSIYPQPAQTTAEVWNAIIAGARGVEYFDQYSDITDVSYTGAGHYPPGAMYNAIKATDARIAALAPVINAPFANGYVKTSPDMSVMAKYLDGHFYIFAIPHAVGPRTATFTLAGAPGAKVTVLGENRTLNVADGAFTDRFADANTVHIYEVSP
jgi:hypothetical protein